MSDGARPHGPVHADVRKLQCGCFRGQVAGVVVGFPCQDISIVGQHLGLDGSRGSVVPEALRLRGEAGPI
eukprot:3397862-Lingulodinium_polyedra.AAC.1